MRWWHVWPIVVALIINSAGLGLIYLRFNSLPQPVSPPPSPISVSANQEVMDKLTLIQNQLSQLQSQNAPVPVLGTADSYTSGQLSDLLPEISASPTPYLSKGSTNTSQRYITVSNAQPGQIDVYKENASFSPVVGQISYGSKYAFSTKLNNWYLITLPSGKIGWVNSQYVKEVPLGQ